MIFEVLYIFLVVGPIGPLVNSTTLLSSMALTWAAIAFADKLLLRRPRIHATMASLPVANSKQASKREVNTQIQWKLQKTIVNGETIHMIHMTNTDSGLASWFCLQRGVPLSLEHWIDTVSHIGRKNNLNNLTAIMDVIHQLQQADSLPVRAKLLHHPNLWMPLRYQWTTVHPNNPKLVSHSLTHCIAQKKTRRC